MSEAMFYRAVRYDNGFMDGIVKVIATDMEAARQEIKATLTRDGRNYMRQASYQRWCETGKMVMVSRDPDGLDVVFVEDEHGNRFEKQGYKWFEVMQLPVSQASEVKMIAQPVQQWQANAAAGGKGDYPVMDYPAVPPEGEKLTAYERATIVQALRHYYDLLFRSNGPHKELVMSDLIVLQNKVLSSTPLSLPQAKPGQLDRIEAMLVAMMSRGGGL